MDMQKVLTDMSTAARNERFKNSKQLTLGEMILKMEFAIDKASREENAEYRNPDVIFDFASIGPTVLDSWRGSYAELALGYEDEARLKADEFLKHLKEAVGKTYTGWKGGDFVMGKSTPMWVANPGNSGETGIYDIIYDGYSIIIVTGKCEF